MPHRGHGGHGPDHRDPGERARAARGESAGEARDRGARQRQLPVSNMQHGTKLELQTIHRFSQSRRRPLLGPSPG